MSGGGLGDHSSYDWGGRQEFPSACKRLSLWKAFSPPLPWLRMGMEGWKEGGMGRQQTGQEFQWALRGGRRVKEGLAMGLEK